MVNRSNSFNLEPAKKTNLQLTSDLIFCYTPTPSILYEKQLKFAQLYFLCIVCILPEQISSSFGISLFTATSCLEQIQQGELSNCFLLWHQRPVLGNCKTPTLPLGLLCRIEQKWGLMIVAPLTTNFLVCNFTAGFYAESVFGNPH